MKKWKEFNRREKGMVIVMIALLIAVVLSWGRVSADFMKGMDLFYGTPADTVNRK